MASVSLRHICKVYQAKNEKKSKKSKAEGKRSGDFLAVKDFNMEIEDGEFIVFVGPSGCGKSTTLRMIAGLEEITAGDLYIDDRLVNDVDPKDRDIAMVFQNYALYPHMTAEENISFGLRMRKVPYEKKDENGNPILAINKKKVKELQKKLKEVDEDLARIDDAEIAAKEAAVNSAKAGEGDILHFETTVDPETHVVEEKNTVKEYLLAKRESFLKDYEYYSTTPVQVYGYKHIPKEEIERKVQWAADVLGVNELLYIKPKAMSGGQRQRIALGRAIVREPKVMLLDEPLSNLDAKLRTAMRSEIVRLHNELKTTFIYVTHDQIEAMTMGTRIVVMKLGIIQQIDSPTNLFDFPDNKFVAGFIGTPQMNFYDVKIKKSGTKLVVTFVDGQTQSYNLANMRNIEPAYLDGQEHEVTLGIRGENMSLNDSGIANTILIKEILGNTTQMFIKLTPDSADSVICLSERNDYKAGDTVKVLFDERRIHLFDKETECSIMGREYGNK